MNDLKERYEKLYAGVIYDVMEFDLKIKNCFLLDESIKPCWEFDSVLFGPAFTCKGEKVLNTEHIDDTVRLKMFQEFYDGCVQVISSGGYRDVAQFGDISGKIAKKFGAMGAVVDAPTRDQRLIKNDQFKLFSRGVQCTDAYGKWQITEYQVPIIMPGIHGDVCVNPGDYIYGDNDGVIVIKKEIVNDVLIHAEKRMERENTIRREIYETNDILELNNRVGRW